MKLRFDSDQWSEIVSALSRNKTRTFLTAFGIFWGVFMLLLLMGGGRGLESTLANNFAGFANNSGFMMAAPTSEAYKGFKKGRRWFIETRDVQLIRSSVPELEVISPTISNWRGSTVVSCGLTMVQRFVPEKPATATSLGTFLPIDFKRFIAPMASVSVKAKMASVLSWRNLSTAAAPSL